MNSARPIATFPPPANGSTQKWTDGPARLSPPRHHPPPPRSLPAILPRTRRLRRPARRATDPRDARRVLTRPRREDAARRGDPTNGPVSHVEREEEGWRSHARSLPGVTDYGDLRRRARGSRSSTSDCSQEKRRKSGKSRRCRPISALLNENRLHHDVDARVRLTQARDSGPSPSARGVRSHTRSRPPSRTVGHRSRSACVSNFDRSPIAGEPPVGHSRHASASIRQALSPSRRDGGRHAEHRGSRERAHLARRGARAIRPGAPRDFRA